MKLVVGLGNPEIKYIATKHNLGYDFIDFWLAIKKGRKSIFDIDIGNNKLQVFYKKIQNQEVAVIKPNTGMNNSGVPIKAAMDVLNIHPKDVIVIYDDMDFEAGQFKIKVGGGDGKHNGIKSIINHIGNEFIRLRMGIGKPLSKEQGLNYVLSEFEDRDVIDRAIINAAIALESIIINGPQKAMMEYNKKV